MRDSVGEQAHHRRVQIVEELKIAAIVIRFRPAEPLEGQRQAGRTYIWKDANKIRASLDLQLSVAPILPYPISVPGRGSNIADRREPPSR
jgi:hypothetical protein